MTADIIWIKAHGFNDPLLGAGSIDKDRRLIVSEAAKRGMVVHVDCDENTDYGNLGLFKVRAARHEPVARMVAAIEKTLDAGQTAVLEGYSNGWNFLLQAIQIVCDGGYKLAPGQHIIMLGIHPAGRTKPDIPPEVTAVWFWITKSDWPCRLATWAGFFRFVPQWGRLGYAGYKGDDPRVVRPDKDISNIAKGHGGAYHDHNLKWGAKEKVEWVLSMFAI